MAEQTSPHRALRFTEEEIKTIEKAMDILVDRDPASKALGSREEAITRVLGESSAYFHSRFEQQLALLSIAIGNGASPLGAVAERSGCNNNCTATCTVSCVNDCNTSCEGSCKGSCKGTCSGVFRS